jgi:hypothetical protein
MNTKKIGALRFYNQRISANKFVRSDQTTTWFGAMQAQDYSAVKWAVGLRTQDATQDSVEKAIADKTIIRTWLMRGTLHIATAADVHWMLNLLAPRIIANSATRNRQLELDQAAFTCSFEILTDVLSDGKVLPRKQLMTALEDEGISTEGQRGYHILRRAGLEGLICFGPKQGKQDTFGLLDEWTPDRNEIVHDEALAELALRYFRSHGPATLEDFTWWSGLTAAQARKAAEISGNKLQKQETEGETLWSALDLENIFETSPTAHLLPAFDEFYLGYKNRSAVLDSKYDPGEVSKAGVFRPIIVINSQIVGTWRRTLKRNRVSILLNLFEVLTADEKLALQDAATHYGKFLGLPVELEDQK